MPLSDTATRNEILMQIRAAQWSDGPGLPADDPFQDQNLSRVVSGLALNGWQP